MSEIVESSAVVKTSAVLESSAVVETSAVVESSAVVETSAVVESSAVVETSAVVESSEVVETSAVVESSAVDETNVVEKPVETDSNEIVENEKTERLTRLPMARIRTLIKADQDVSIASLESVFLITKATELFIEALGKEMHKVTQGQKRKTVYKKDMESVIEMLDEYAFLDGALE